MEIFALQAYASGYRGCLIEAEGYLFFQYSRKGRLKRLKSYPKSDFADLDHFMALMFKFITPSIFLRPPIAIDALTLEELDRVYASVQKSPPR